MTNYEMVKEWMKKFGHPTPSYPCDISQVRHELRLNLIVEEMREYEEAFAKGSLPEMADALTDLLYVVYGAGIEHGFPMDELFAEVQKSNMSKLGADGHPIYREDGKILKGPNFKLPDIETILKAHAPK